MAHLYLVRHCYIAVAHHIHGAPLMSILAIALFLVVRCRSKHGHVAAKSHSALVPLSSSPLPPVLVREHGQLPPEH